MDFYTLRTTETIVASILLIKGINISHQLAQSAAKVSTLSASLISQKAATDSLASSVAALTIQEKQKLVADINAAVASGALTAEEGAQILTTLGLTTAEGALTIANKGLAASFKSLMASIPVWGWIALGISVVIEAVSLLTNTVGDSTDKLTELNQEYDEIRSSMDEISKGFRDLKSGVEGIAPRFAELARGVDEFGNNVSLTDEEYQEFLELNNKIAKMFPQLNLGMDSNGNYIQHIAFRFSPTPIYCMRFQRNRRNIDMKYSSSNKPMQCMMTQSTCYRGTGKMNVVGVLWNCTGANNPWLKRYVQPDDNASDRAALLAKLGTNAYKNDWNHTSVQVGLNCWIGKLADGTVTTVQTMPWDYRPWGCGSGSKGSCNNGWIQFEMCEDALTDATYFNAVYKEACELTAYLCKMYNIDPKGSVTLNGVKVPTILCHQDSYKLGLGSNHGDVYNWFNKHGKTMDNVRADVAALLGSSGSSGGNTGTTSGGTTTSFKSGDVVKITGTTYYNGKSVPGWVLAKKWIVYSASGDRVVINKSEDGVNAIMSPFKASDLALASAAQTTTPVTVTGTVSTGSDADKKNFHDFFMGKLNNEFGVAGLWGNIYAESGGRSNNLQNTYETKLGYTDASYTTAVDNGSYTNFVNDKAGYGLVQWTFETRKKALLDYAKAAKKSIGDYATQLAFLYKELSEGYADVLKTLKNAKTVKEASDAVLTQFERPADTSDAVKTKRAGYGQEFYNKFATSADTVVTEKPSDSGCYASEVIAVAQGELGYYEKASNSNLDDKTANKGSANYTKYARDFDSKYPNWYNGKKNGYAWCDMFVDWCFLTAFGYEKALYLLCQPEKSAGAGCTYSLRYYKAKGQFYTSNPKAGDQIFFGTSVDNSTHTGLVEKVEGGKVYTIEGNTSDMVARRTYTIGASNIVGYGRPNYDGAGSIVTTEPSTGGSAHSVLRKGSTGSEVEELQRKLTSLGYALGSVDGDFGEKTLAAVKAFQKDYSLDVDGVVGNQTWTALDNAVAAKSSTTSYRVKVTTEALNIRAGAGTNYNIVGCIRDKGVYTIVEEKAGWGRLKSGVGWICLEFTKKV